MGRLEFHPIRAGRFPCYDLARRTLEQGQSMTCALNAANQVAVEEFLAGRIAFGDIAATITSTLEILKRGSRSLPARPGIRSLLDIEARATDLARTLVAGTGKGN
jgi:1-deoxy-D-xylulose-5-phosphate reductoisomerase